MNSITPSSPSSTTNTESKSKSKQQHKQRRRSSSSFSNAFLFTIVLLLSGPTSNLLAQAQTLDPTPSPTRSPTLSPIPSKSPTASPSGNPSVHPTSSPSGKPTVHPTGSPSGKPTASPSGNPSVHPTSTPSTPLPTRTPSSKPSPSPSNAPSVSPTVSPTDRPSYKPSDQPSIGPTLNPSVHPTVVPTTEPTAEPSVSPTSTPSTRPTAGPTVSAQPSSTPSYAPTDVPTTIPSDVPSIGPTPLASGVPSVSFEPTPFPTPEPTRSPIDPTGYPTPDPSSKPSAKPSVSPTSKPSAKPSAQPSPAPSVSPTVDPTSTATTATIEGISMTLQNMTSSSKLENEARAEWAMATEQHLVEFYNGAGGQEGAVEEYGPVQILDVVTTYVSSSFNKRRRHRDTRGLLRYLEEESSSTTTNAVQKSDLIIQYTQKITYRTDSTLVQPSDIASDPFATRLRRELFLDILKTSSTSGVFDPISGISAVSVEPPVASAPSPAPSAKLPSNPTNLDDGDDNSSGGSSNLWIIIGSAIGVAVIMAAAAAGYLLMNKNRRHGGGDRGTSESAGLSSEYGFSASNAGDEHSTLAEPTPRLGVISSNESLALYGDQSITTQDYDYAKAYGNTSVSSAGGTFGSAALGAGVTSSAVGGDAPSFFTKDPTFDALYGSASPIGAPLAGAVKEEIIDVYCPPGKLGVVIDTPDDGAPVVHAVKDSSVVADQVKVGDKVVAVDDEDVRVFTAIKVSKMISRKSANPTRKLTLVRTTT